MAPLSPAPVGLLYLLFITNNEKIQKRVSIKNINSFENPQKILLIRGATMDSFTAFLYACHKLNGYIFDICSINTVTFKKLSFGVRDTSFFRVLFTSTLISGAESIIYLSWLQQ